MNLSEFKAWFEGFTENISDKPTKAQWTRIQKKVKSITSDPTPYPIFLERYVEPYRYWWHAPVLTGTTAGSMEAANNTVTLDYSLQSFADAGRAEAASMTN